MGESGKVGGVEADPFGAEDDVGPVGAEPDPSGFEPGGETVDDADGEAVGRGDFGS